MVTSPQNPLWGALTGDCAFRSARDLSEITSPETDYRPSVPRVLEPERDALPAERVDLSPLTAAAAFADFEAEPTVRLAVGSGTGEVEGVPVIAGVLCLLYRYAYALALRPSWDQSVPPGIPQVQYRHGVQSVSPHTT